jgi:hypothetical protein
MFHDPFGAFVLVHGPVIPVLKENRAVDQCTNLVGRERRFILLGFFLRRGERARGQEQ